MATGRASSSNSSAPRAPDTVDDVARVLRNQVEHPRCAKCGHPATLGMMLTDGAGTGPWLCHPSSFLGRSGCRSRPRL